MLSRPAPVTLMHPRGYYAGARPPDDALWAYVAGSYDVRAVPARPSAAGAGRQMRAQWESELVTGALRDDFCAAGGRPLVGWSVNGAIGVSERTYAFGQRFPNPTAERFRRRLRLIGQRYGFRVVSLRLLRPRGLAPLIVVSTDRSRPEFVRDVPAIMTLIDPTAASRDARASTFEGVFLEARDGDGAFVRVQQVLRGTWAGGQWSWNRCEYPYEHTEPVTAKPCPN